MVRSRFFRGEFPIALLVVQGLSTERAEPLTLEGFILLTAMGALHSDLLSLGHLTDHVGFNPVILGNVGHADLPLAGIRFTHSDQVSA